MRKRGGSGWNCLIVTRKLNRHLRGIQVIRCYHQGFLLVFYIIYYCYFDLKYSPYTLHTIS